MPPKQYSNLRSLVPVILLLGTSGAHVVSAFSISVVTDVCINPFTPIVLVIV